MCTLSLIRLDDGYRLVHSRDEQRSRSPQVAPAWRDLSNGLRAIWPTDPDGGGTWIAVRTDGVCLAIMNVNPEPPPGPPPAIDRSTLRTRGAIVPELIGRDDPASEAALAGVAARRHAPFRLVAVAPDGSARTLTWRGTGEPVIGVVEAPACWVSSGLGDSAVAARLPLFDELVRPRPDIAAQDAFHAHRWPGRGAESVMMSRQDARTVSVTEVVGQAGEVSLRSTPIGAAAADGGA